MDVLFAIGGDDVVHMPFMRDVVHDVGTRRTERAFLQAARPCKVPMQSLPCRRGRPRHFLEGMEDSTMPLTKQASKRKRRKEVVPALGVVGVSLSLAGGASAATAPAADVPSPNTARVPEITLNEEEISDVSLGTFYVFDKESTGSARLGEQVARGCGGCRGCGRGCRGCRGCGRGCGGCGGCGCGGGGCCLSWGVCRIC
jgi:hypothetical protein